MKTESTISIDAALVERLYRKANAKRWRVPHAGFMAALEASCTKAFPDGDPGSDELSRSLSALHLEDLALACACALGDPHAWDHFVLEMRPGLYRAADALDPSGGARELADSLYGDMYGIDSRGEARTSLLRYYHGRSSLATWLRAVLAHTAWLTNLSTYIVDLVPPPMLATAFGVIAAGSVHPVSTRCPMA